MLREQARQERTPPRARPRSDTLVLATQHARRRGDELCLPLPGTETMIYLLA